MNNTRETMPYTELLNIKNYLAQKGIDSSIKGIKVTPEFMLMPRLRGIDGNGNDIKFCVRISICSYTPYTLRLKAKMRFSESLEKKAKELLGLLVEYDYSTMRRSN